VRTHLPLARVAGSLRIALGWGDRGRAIVERKSGVITTAHACEGSARRDPCRPWRALAGDVARSVGWRSGKGEAKRARNPGERKVGAQPTDS